MSVLNQVFFVGADSSTCQRSHSVNNSLITGQNTSFLSLSIRAIRMGICQPLSDKEGGKNLSTSVKKYEVIKVSTQSCTIDQKQQVFFLLLCFMRREDVE